MIQRLLLTILLSLFALTSHAVADSPQKVVSGYLPYYRIADWSGEVGPVTDLILFGLKVSPEGKLDASQISAAHLAKVQKAKERSGCRVLLCVGGWGKSSGFATMSADPELRRQFIQQVSSYCRENGFDGVDYDWEYPEGDAQVHALSLLLAETRTELAPQHRLVTIAQAAWHRIGKKCYDSVDRVHLMSYDHGFPQATMEKSQLDVKRMLDDGCPVEKIVLGVPFYGRDQQRKTRTYAQLTRRPGFSKDTSIVDGFAFNSPALIAEKIAYIKDQNLAGIMIWEIGQDGAGEWSLLKAVDEAMRK